MLEVPTMVGDVNTTVDKPLGPVFELAVAMLPELTNQVILAPSTGLPRRVTLAVRITVELKPTAGADSVSLAFTGFGKVVKVALADGRPPAEAVSVTVPETAGARVVNA
jgi:hypothetical protein